VQGVVEACLCECERWVEVGSLPGELCIQSGTMWNQVGGVTAKGIQRTLNAHSYRHPDYKYHTAH
jgi:hypothetical protein